MTKGEEAVGEPGQREAHDRDGVDFAGHDPLRPLLAHPEAPDAWTVPVDGDDAYAVAVGPIHAGVIESGHFRFDVVGERILHLDTRLFYGHRGLERAAEGRTPAEALAVVELMVGLQWRPAPKVTINLDAGIRTAPFAGLSSVVYF